MKLYKHLLVALGVSLATVSCDDYLDVNDTPNSPTQNLVQPDPLLAGALEDPYRTPLSVQMNTTGNALVNHWAGDINNFAGGFQDEFTLNFTTTYQNGIWNELYRSCNTFQAIINDPTEDYDNHKAIAKVRPLDMFNIDKRISITISIHNSIIRKSNRNACGVVRIICNILA